MLSDSRLVAFAATADAEQARAFYSSILELTENEITPFALVYDVNGVTLRIQIAESVAAPGYTVIGWEVNEIVDTVQRLTQRGVKFERYPSLPQDELCVWTTPDGAMVAWFRDPDGNLLSLTQPVAASD